MSITSSLESLDRYIDKTPGIAGGKPRLAGRRITVQDVAVWHVRMGQSVDEICAAYELGLAEVHAALAYYYDHRSEIDTTIASGTAFAEQLRRSIPSVLQRRLKELGGE